MTRQDKVDFVIGTLFVPGFMIFLFALVYYLKGWYPDMTALLFVALGWVTGRVSSVEDFKSYGLLR